MSIQFVEVNGKLMPTTEFIKNRERLLNVKSKEETKKEVSTVENIEISDEKTTELTQVPLEEKTELIGNSETINTDVSNEKKDVPVKKVSGFTKINRK